jgi:hypothetical protein
MRVERLIIHIPPTALKKYTDGIAPMARLPFGADNIPGIRLKKNHTSINPYAYFLFFKKYHNERMHPTGNKNRAG